MSMTNRTDSAIVGRAAVITTLAGGSGGLTALLFRFWRTGNLEVRRPGGGGGALLPAVCDENWCEHIWVPGLLPRSAGAGVWAQFAAHT